MSEPVHPLFIKYKRDWLHKVTGYSIAYLSRVATGKTALSCAFIQRVCFKLNQPKAGLFLPDCDPVNCSSGEHKLSQWLADKCIKEHLSLRQAAAKTGLSHVTIDDIIKGKHPSPETIGKLAKAFAGGTKERLALEDHLLMLASYRTQRPEGEEPSELVAHLMDKVEQFSELQLKIIDRFADFLIEIEAEAAVGIK